MGIDKNRYMSKRLANQKKKKRKNQVEFKTKPTQNRIADAPIIHKSPLKWKDNQRTLALFHRFHDW
jgi:hypothetical protein